MTPHPLTDMLRGIGIQATERDGALVLRGPRENLTPEIVATLKRLKPRLLAALTADSANADETPAGDGVRGGIADGVESHCPDWRVDERGRLVFPDGTIYSPTPAGGWILTKHRRRSMIRPGTFTAAEVAP